MSGRVNPSPKTFNLLYARSGNRCAFPRCPTPITIEQTLLGEVAHIRAASPNGPRYDPNQSDEQRRAYDNLILLCGVHHKVVDDDEEAYTVSRLEKMKFDHEANATAVSRDEAEKAANLFIQGDHAVVAHTLHNTGVLQQINNHYGFPVLAPVSTKEFIGNLPKEGQSRFRANGERLGLAKPFSPFNQAPEVDVFLREGRSVWLRVLPIEKPGRELRFGDLERLKFKLNTMLYSADQTVTATDGLGRYLMAYDLPKASAVSFFFRTGEIWSVDTNPFFSPDEQITYFAFHEARSFLPKSLALFGELLNDAQIRPPYKWIAGLEKVAGVRLNAGDPRTFFFNQTSFMADDVVASGSYTPGEGSEEAIDEFFEAMFSECGQQRPEHLVYKKGENTD